MIRHGSLQDRSKEKGLTFGQVLELLVAGEGKPQDSVFSSKSAVTYRFYTQKVSVTTFHAQRKQSSPNGKKWQSSPPLW